MAFKDILKKQRQSGAGIASSLGTAASSTVRENLDIRNYLFTKGSLLGALFPNVKGFKAGAGGNVPKSAPNLFSPSSMSAGLSDDKLNIISQNTKIAAKNSMVLPAMARDMNVMRQNIVKMVKLSGGSPSTKADMFFMKASEREKSYESQLQESKTPTKVGTDSSSQDTGGLKGFFNTLLIGLLATVGVGLFKYFTDGEFKNSIDENLIKPLKENFIDPIISKVKELGGELLLVAGAAAALKLAFAGITAGTIIGAISRLALNPYVIAAAVAAYLIHSGRNEADEMVDLQQRYNKSLSDPNAPKLTADEEKRRQELNRKNSMNTEQNLADLQSLSNPSDEPSALGNWFKEFLKFGVGKGDAALRGESTAPAPVPPAPPVPTQSPTPAAQTNGDNLTFNSLSRKEQDILLDKQFEKEGNRPGNLAYDLNNPGAMLWSPKAAQFGAVKDPNRGVGELKGQFARFPTFEQGREAQRDLWSRKYGDLPLNQAINKWTTGKLEGDGSLGVENYKSGIFAALGKSNVTPTDSMTRIPGATVAAATTQLSSMTASSNQAPVIISAPQTNVQSGSTGGSSGNMANVVDSDFMKHLTRIAV
jgi:hypothetical protein